MKIRLLLLSMLLCCCFNTSFSQSGTFNFYPTTSGDGTYLSETVSGVTLTIYSDHSDTPPSITLQDWSEWPPFTNDAATMNGIPKPSCTITFSQAVNITTILVADFNSGYPHLLFTPNTGAPYDGTVDSASGTYFTLNFVGITSFVITNYDGGNVCLGVDQVVMDATLPVGLAAFTASIEKQAVILKWITESETDNLGFILERAEANSTWQQIASYQTNPALKGHGNASTTTTYTFTDNTVSAGKEYRYRLADVNSTGTLTMHSPISITTAALPQSTSMLNAYPNPFNPETKIEYQLHQDSQITITVYDLLGNKIKTLINERQSAGSYHVVWNGTNVNGAKAASGAYIVRMQTKEVTQTQKVLLLK